MTANLNLTATIVANGQTCGAWELIDISYELTVPIASAPKALTGSHAKTG